MDARDELEMTLGHSHRCSECRHTFLQHQDGCPLCGPGAHTRSLNTSPIIPEDAETISETYYDPETGEFHEIE